MEFIREAENDERIKFYLGDIVTIREEGRCYSTYKDFFKFNGLSNSNWHNGDSLKRNWEGVIVGFGEHESDSDIIIAVVYIPKVRQKYLIGLEGIQKVVKMTKEEIEDALGYKIEIIG